MLTVGRARSADVRGGDLLLAIVAPVATVLTAIRAVGVDPMLALRSE
jgi:hypothetical protein